MKKLTAISLLSAALTMSTAMSSVAAPGGGGGGFPVGGSIPVVSTPVTPVAAHITVAPAASFAAPIQQAAVFVTPVLPGAVGYQIQPIDSTNPTLLKGSLEIQSPQLAFGIKEIDENQFQPKTASAKDAILVRPEEGTKFNMTAAYAAKLDEGVLLVSVPRPSNFGLIETPDGLVSLSADSHVLVSYIGGVLRVENLSARGERCKIKIGKTVLDGSTKVVALAPGYELVASDHKLMNGEMRPADGIARRRGTLMANGHMAVNEFNAGSALVTSSIVAKILNDSDKADQRRLNHMYKMAAVLDFVHGTKGFTSAGRTGIATKPGAGTQ